MTVCLCGEIMYPILVLLPMFCQMGPSHVPTSVKMVHVLTTVMLQLTPLQQLPILIAQQETLIIRAGLLVRYSRHYSVRYIPV